MLLRLKIHVVLLLLMAFIGCQKELMPPEELDPTPKAGTNCIFKTIDGEVVMDAENFTFEGGSRGRWLHTSATDGYLGTGYMQSNEAEPLLTFDTAICKLAYEIEFDQCGIYYVHLRSYASDHRSNGFFATFDGREVSYGGSNPVDSTLTAQYIYVEKVGKWFWYTDGGGAETRGLEVSFEVQTTGRHIFSIYRRDTGSKLDHIWLSMDRSKPNSLEDLALPNSKDFILNSAVK